MTPEEFRAAGHELIDWIADYRIRLGDLPVAAAVNPGDVRRALAGPPPQQPESLSALIADLDNVIVPGLTQVQSPRNFAWFPSNASLASVLGDLTSSGLGALGITWQSAPALTELEELVTDWLRELCGLGPQWRGAIHDTASTGTLVALLAARERASQYSQFRDGLQGHERPMVVYASPDAHSSVTKAALLAGYGAANLRHVAVDPRSFAMDWQSLAEQMAADATAGRTPAAVVASIGTTATTAVDPVAEIVEVAGRYGAWVHVDAAMAGSAMLLPECRDMFVGVQGADSLGWNPHKWMGTVLDCSLLYVRDPQALTSVMTTSPTYLQSPVDGAVTQYKDWGIPLGRRFRALKLWFQLRLDGVEAIQARLRRDLANAAWLAEQVRSTKGWELTAPVSLQTVCVRHIPAAARDCDADELDEHNQAWARAINDSGKALVTSTKHAGRWIVRVSVGAESTQLSDVVQLWQLMRATAEGEFSARSPGVEVDCSPATGRRLAE